MIQIGVDCQFAADGTVRVRRVHWHGKWQSVGQGRQWVDGVGRHVLIMLPNNQTHKILLRSDTLTWILITKEPPSKVV
ncbi:MAG: hypothetical protein GY796_15010 [Chloroflexi bacterium]|nr:hypothetical protein [Chloroflexota bacterium]